EFTLNELGNNVKRTLETRGLFYNGYEERAGAFAHPSREITFVERQNCSDMLEGISGPSTVQPSGFYTRTSAYIDVPFYALGGEEVEAYKIIEAAIEMPEEEMFFVQSSTNSKVPFHILIPYWKLLELGCHP